MSKGVNKVILIGNVGKDPDMRYMPNGNAVANVTLATSESWKDKASGETQERTEWHRVVFFRRLGEIVGEYVKKGSKIYVEGKLQTRKWQDQSGQDRYTTEIVADELQMLDSRGSANAPAGSSRPSSSTGTANRSPAPPAASPAPAAPGYDSFDDDIPFAIYQRRMVV